MYFGIIFALFMFKSIVNQQNFIVLNTRSFFAARVSFVLICFFPFFGQVSGQSFSLDLSSKTYEGDTIVIGNFYGDKQLVVDTIISKNKRFVWATDTMPSPGVYFALLKPKNNYFQILVNGIDKKISIEFDPADLEDLKVKGSEDNKLFNEYVFFLKDKRVFADSLKNRVTRAKAANLPTNEYEDQYSGLDNEVKAFQDKLIAVNPSYLTTMLIKSNQEVPAPNYEGEEKDVQTKKYLFFKEHYFDNLYMQNPAVIRTPFIHQKIDFYVNKGVSQEPDSLVKAIDRILLLFEGNKKAYEYYLSYFLNTYGQLKMVGHDAIVVHLADKYYLKGKATWSTKENLAKLKESVDDLRPGLIGKTMPNYTTYKKDGTSVTLYDIKSKYTLMVVYAPDCGNCSKTMPFIVDFYNKHQDKGIKVISICSKGGDKINTCWPYIDEKKMQNFINTGDEYQRWQQLVRSNKTPKIFIMDSNKKILMKDMSGEDLEKIFLQIYEYDQKNPSKS
jgi:thiol-disulfide isomerase/thioredoxin